MSTARRLLSHGLLTLAAIGCGCASTFAAGLPGDIAQNLNAANERMRKVYAHATVAGSITRDYPREQKSSTQQFVLRAAGERLRLDLTVTAQQDMKLVVGSSRMHMATPYGSLTTYRPPGAQVFADARQLPYSKAQDEINRGCMLSGAYLAGDDQTFAQMLQSSSVTITKVKRLEEDGEPLVRIEYDQVARHGQISGPWKCSLVLAPDQGWAVREQVRTSGQGSQAVSLRAQLTYSGLQNGVPLIQSMQWTEEQGPQLRIAKRELVSVSQFIPGDPANRYYTAFDF